MNLKNRCSIGWFVSAVFFLSPFLLLSCGSDDNAVSQGDEGQTARSENGEPEVRPSIFDTLMVQGAGDLPACDASREGRAFFVRNDNLPHFCVKGTWRSAADSTDFSITCSDGFLHAVDKIEHPEYFDPDTVMLTGYSHAPFSGTAFATSGPFIFGTNVKIAAMDNESIGVAEGCILSNDGKYVLNNVSTNASCVKVTATGFYRNGTNGRFSDSPVTLSANTCNPLNANINVLTHLRIPREQQLLMNHLDSVTGQAEREFFAAFGVDTVQLYSQNYFTDGRTDKPHAEDLSLTGNTEYNAALLAMSMMLQAGFDENEMMNLVNNFAEDIKGDGVWNDPNWKIKIADWVVGLDSSWKYNDIRNNVSSWGIGPVPNFENYMRAFIPLAYGFEPCTDANSGVVTYVNQGQSAYFANDYEHADHSTVRFICDAGSKQWRVAQPMEKDTAGFGPGAYDREIREGRVIHDNYYIYDAGAWRVATPQEADGFTDIVEVYANLKSDEKAVFIIRHSERTDDTGPSGHLTDNGKKYARDLGARFAAVAKEDFYYGYSGYTRTQETCENIAQGKGQSNYSLDVLPYMDGAWYVKDDALVESYMNSDGGGWVVYSKYAFTGAYPDAFYDLETRSEQLLKDNVLANLASMKRVNVMCTHDFLVVPLLAYTTNGHANVKYYEKWKWVNYMAGVAMIISPDGSMRYIPVKGLETGVM